MAESKAESAMRFRPSAAHRWMHCPASWKYSQGLPDDPSEQALYGTLAHAIAERLLSGKKILKAQLDRLASKRDLEYIEGYVEYVRSVAGLKHMYMVETKVNFTERETGTADAVVIAPEWVHVIDLKFGEGWRVEVTEDEQLLCYALGVLRMLKYITDDLPRVFRMTIYQPRMANVNTYEVPTQYLETMWADEVEAAIKRCKQREPEFIPGEKQCRFCPYRSHCAAYSRRVLEVATSCMQSSEHLSIAQMESMLKAKDFIVDWLKMLEQTVFKYAQAGQTTRYKIVESNRTKRFWKPGMEDFVKKRKIKKSDLYMEVMRSPNQLEEHLGKAVVKKLFADYIDRGKPGHILVPVDDPRPSVGNENQFDNLPEGDSSND